MKVYPSYITPIYVPLLDYALCVVSRYTLCGQCFVTSENDDFFNDKNVKKRLKFCFSLSKTPSRYDQLLFAFYSSIIFLLRSKDFSDINLFLFFVFHKITRLKYTERTVLLKYK